MSDNEDDTLEYYPAYCFAASPTWFTWVKLTAYNVHHDLESSIRSEYLVGSDTLLLFYRNHPVRFVQLVGVVVNVDDYEKYWLFTIDDGSGATIDVTYRKQTQTQTQGMDKLDNGVVVLVKGQLTTFRHVRQLCLERITIVSNTNQEMRLIAGRIAFFRNVLSQPWVVSDLAKARLLKEASEEKQRNREQDQIDREKRHEIRILKKYQRDEARRAACAQEAKAAGELLKNKIDV